MTDEDRQQKIAGLAFDKALQELASEGRKEVVASNATLKDGAIERLIAVFEEAAETDERGVKFWTARSLATLLEYNDYRNFLNTVGKAKVACGRTGQQVHDHFVDVTDMVGIGSGAERPIDDIRLSRYACYLAAMNGDSRKNLLRSPKPTLPSRPVARKSRMKKMSLKLSILRSLKTKKGFFFVKRLRITIRS